MRINFCWQTAHSAKRHILFLSPGFWSDCHLQNDSRYPSISPPFLSIVGWAAVITSNRTITNNTLTSSWAPCYKTFYDRNLRAFLISSCVCPWQAFTALSNICGWGPEPTLEWSTWKVLHSGRLLVLISNIRLGCWGLPGTNTLAYYENP
jgi:hypothetical protein